MTSTMEHKAKKILIKTAKTALTIAFWLGLWQLIYALTNNDVLVASPIKVAERLIAFLPDGEFWLSVWNSFLGVFRGYIIGVFLGVLLGISTALSDILHTLFKPFLTAVKTTPVVSFIILALVWLPKMRVPVFITVLMVMPIVWANIASGIRNTDRKLLEMASAYDFSFKSKLKLIYLPSALPSFFAACETAVGLGWKAGIAAEVLCTPDNTIGMNLKNSQVYIETADLFAWTAAVIILSLVLEKLLVAVMKYVSRNIMRKGGYFLENSDK